MQGISFTDGGGFQFGPGPSGNNNNQVGMGSMGKSLKMGQSNQSMGAGSYGARFYGGA